MPQHLRRLTTPMTSRFRPVLLAPLALLPTFTLAIAAPNPVKVSNKGSETSERLTVTEIDPGVEKGPDRAQVRKKGRFQLDFEKVEIDKLIQTMSDLTGKLFILPDNIRGAKISIIGPEHGRQGVTVDEAYAAFLAALDAAGLSLYETGRKGRRKSKRLSGQYV